MKKLFKKTFQILLTLLSKKENSKSKANLSDNSKDKIRKNYNYLYSNYTNFIMIVERQMKHEYAYWVENKALYHLLQTH